jgi:hypothetical protein
MPRKTKQAIQAAAELRLAEADRGGERLVDLQIDWISPDGSRFARFGGRWDSLEHEWDGDAETSLIVKLHEGQMLAARWFYEWLGIWQGAVPSDKDKIYSALLCGGRRGGKTTLGMDCVHALAVAEPNALAWVVAPSEDFYDEPIGCIERALPSHWYTSLFAPHWKFFLVNGSEIVLRSAHKPRRLKHGGVDLLFLNEAQQISQQAMNTASGGSIDSGGLMLAAANPPDIGDVGTWVADLAQQASRDLRKHARYFFLNPERNPHIDQGKLRAMREQMTEHEYAVQILGEFRLPPDAVLYAWDKGPKGNERPAPGARVLELAGGGARDIADRAHKDVTAEFTRHFEGIECTDIFGVDVQNYPWHALIRLRAFENPHYAGDMEQAILWGVGEFFLDKGDEVELAEGAKDLVYRGERPDPTRTLVVMDGSGDWQQMERDLTRQRPRYKGQGSMDMFRGSGYANVVGPDRYMDANPLILDRCRAANSRICTASKRRLVFLDPELCPRAVSSIQNWKREKSGMPSRRANAAHGCDAMTYVIWRFFPRRARGGTTGGAPAVHSRPTRKRRSNGDLEP